MDAFYSIVSSCTVDHFVYDNKRIKQVIIQGEHHMKKVLLVLGTAMILLSLAACGNNNSSKKDKSSSEDSNKTQANSEKVVSSRKKEISVLKKETSKLRESQKQSKNESDKIVGTLTVQQMKSHPKQSAVAITYYGVNHYWGNLSGRITDGFNVSIKTPNSSTVKYYIQKGDNPYYRLIGDERNTVAYYDNADNELQKNDMATIATYVNQKLTDDDRTRIVTNVTINANKNTQEKTDNNPYDSQLSENEWFVLSFLYKQKMATNDDGVRNALKFNSHLLSFGTMDSSVKLVSVNDNSVTIKPASGIGAGVTYPKMLILTKTELINKFVHSQSDVNDIKDITQNALNN